MDNVMSDVKDWLKKMADTEQMESDNLQARAANCVEGTAAEIFQRLSAKHFGKALAFRNTLAFIDLTEAVHDGPTVGEVEAEVAKDVVVDGEAFGLSVGDTVTYPSFDERFTGLVAGFDVEAGKVRLHTNSGPIWVYCAGVEKVKEPGVWPVEVVAGTVDHPTPGLDKVLSTVTPDDL